MKPVILCIGVAAISIFVMLLYDQPAEPVIYCFVLCFLFILGLFSIDYYRFKIKYCTLINIEDIVMNNIENLPFPSNGLEERYSSIIKNLCNDNHEIVNDFELKRKDMMDYYNMWVHQIKTPISAMRLLLQSEECEQNKELSAELFKIEQYVDMVLCYLRQDNMNNDLIIKYYELDSIIKQAVRKYAKEFIRRGIALEYSEVNVEVITDEKWLLFVIEQIISNALKYTKEGKINIYMKEDEMCTLVIEDSGIGIEQEDLPRIFEKGYTGYNGRMDKKSTGIGLYLCKNIIDKLKHTIRVESDRGEGTRVYIGLSNKVVDIRD